MEILGIQTTNPNHQLIIIVEVCAGDSRWFCQGYMLIASDGVWDFLSNEEVSSLVPWLQGWSQKRDSASDNSKIFYCHPDLFGEDSHFWHQHIFLNGLKPPTSSRCVARLQSPVIYCKSSPVCSWCWSLCHDPSYPHWQVLGCIANGGTLEDATMKLLARAKETWKEYDENYCDTRLGNTRIHEKTL